MSQLLKAHSAALGVTKVQASCDSMQRFADMGDNETVNVLTLDGASNKISTALEEAKEEYKLVEAWLRRWYLEAKA